ncbi:ctr copper transporter [Apiospora arundinis]
MPYIRQPPIGPPGTPSDLQYKILTTIANWALFCALVVGFFFFLGKKLAGAEEPASSPPEEGHELQNVPAAA